jgi:hypothetical protein
MIDRLRPDPDRGWALAAGAVALAVATVVIEIRMRQWGTGGRFVVPAIVGALTLTIAWLAPRNPEPLPWLSALLVAGLLTLIIALVELSKLLGASHSPGAGAVFWTFAVEAALAFGLAVTFNSGISVLIAGLAGSIAGIALIYWLFSPHGVSTFRAIVIVETALLVAAAWRVHGSRRRHAVQLINTAGLLALALALTFAAFAAFSVATPQLGAIGQPALPGAPGFGWKLYVVVVGAALILYAMLEREPGPAVIGTAVLYVFAVMAGLTGLGHGSIVGWPLILLIVGGAGIAFGLAPRAAAGSPPPVVPPPPPPPPPPASSPPPTAAP